MRMAEPRPQSNTIVAAVVVVLTIAAAAAAGMRPGGGWFSTDVSYRLQTEAMLRGTFALQPVPHGQRADWAWGHGSQQVWGIGVPILRMPGELIARAAGQGGFPDRVTLIALFAIVIVTLTRAVRGDALQRIAIALAVGLLPGFITMLRSRMFVYEEAVVYAYLWAALQIGLLIGVVSKRDARWSYAAAAAAGFGALIRPTQFLYGAATVAMLVAVHRRLRARVAVIAIFSVVTLSVLWTNVARFGDPFEFGQRVNVSRWVADQFAKNFDYPFAHEPPLSAARELAAGILGRGVRFNGNDFYAAGPTMHPWFSSTLRFREFYFTTGLAPFLLIAVAAWVLIGASVLLQRASAFLAPWVVVGGWSFLSFAAMTVFYLRMPTLTSRYVMDFAAAIAAGVVALLLWVFDENDRRKRFGVAAVAAMAALLALGIAGGAVSSTHTAQPLATADITTTLPQPVMTGPAVPTGYQCGDRLDAVRVPFNGVGWQSSGDCSLEAGTTLFLTLPADRNCVDIELEPEVDRSEVAVKFAATLLERKGSLFCVTPGFTRNPTGVEIVSLKWIPATALTVSSRPSFKMRSIAVR